MMKVLLPVTLLFAFGMASVASAIPVTYAFAGMLGTGLPINSDYDDALIEGTFTFDDEDRVNTGFHPGYRATDWNISVLGGDDPVGFVSSLEMDDAFTIVLNRSTNQVEIAFTEDLSDVPGARFSNSRHSILVRFDVGLDIVSNTEWSDFSAQSFAPNSGFENGTLQFTGGQIPHSITSASLVLVPEPGTATLLMFGLAVASVRRK